MIAHQLLLLWQEWGGAITAASSGAAGWYGRIGATKMQARRDRLDAGQQALQLVQAMQARETTLQATVAAYSTELDTVRQRLWAVDTMMEQLHGSAIAARMMVHQLEQRFGLPTTEFAPLPPFPYPSISDTGAATAAPARETGTQASNPPPQSDLNHC